MSTEERDGGLSQRGSNKRLLLLATILVPLLTITFGMRSKAAKLPSPEIRLSDTTPRGQEVSSEQRQRFRLNFQEKFSKKFQGSKVDLEGDGGKTFCIEWPGVDRSFAATITETGEIIKDLRDMGFTHLIISDGHKSNWNVDLNN
ncbi:hypothetical protein GeomeDRAFT_2234 [Geobacter metallireducens RCH3]|uniref:Uncharacterized protein n=1 Tax=Geobacter metallireducens (strain ATCC 53774 / DSM 7210 / GS-15) TaxID=269799 RepID=Q39R55_GEOMG|nr:hypothetical protein [Geobacter metallireducens]ABB33269.1 hypothetical protein Gmet_3054 [Geobacter metallireducens GS-15]EHP85847.1 hypothetical protein GeomeDRAFT_2234 [Geobacter metallireducens RCH3]